MQIRQRPVRALSALVAVVVLVATFAPTDAGAAPVARAALEASGPYDAFADAALLTVQTEAVEPLLGDTTLDLARSTAAADSEGDLSAEPGNQRTRGVAATTGETSLLDTPIDLQTVEATAPPPEKVSDVAVGPLDIPGLLNLSAITASAEANWAGDTKCVAAGVPLSSADQVAVQAAVADGDLIRLQPDDGGVIGTEAATFLAPIPGDGDPRAITSVVNTTLAGASLLDTGDGALLEIDVVNDPGYVVSASGIPGGATVTGADPVVKVTLDDGSVIVVNAQTPATADLLGLTLGELLTGLDPLLDPLQPVVKLSIPVDRQEAADGTSASVEASLLRVEILPPDVSGLSEPLADLLTTILGALDLDITSPLAQIDLGPMHAAVNAPAGGITCGDDDPDNPLRDIRKDASVPTVAAGESFDYDISLPNSDDECTLTDVAVTDVITGSPGTQISATNPPADSITASDDGRTHTVTWTDVGPIKPGDTVSLTVTVDVPGNAAEGQVYSDTLTVSALCNGQPFENTTSLDQPVVGQPGVGQPGVGQPGVDSPLPRTGLDTRMLFVGAFGLAALGWLMRRRLV